MRKRRFTVEQMIGVLKQAQVESPQIVSILITSKLVPMQFVSDLGTQVIAPDQVSAAYLNSLLERPDDL
jgi:hypothetical protein